MSVYRPTRGGIQSPYYTIKFQFRGTPITRRTRFTLKADAERRERELRHALEAGRWEILDELRLRQPPVATTIAQILALYPTYAQAKPATVAGNITSLKAILRRAWNIPTVDDAALARPLSALNADLIWTWKQNLTTYAAAQAQLAADAGEDPQYRRAQILRSANSLLRQARSIFTPHLLEAYRRHRTREAAALTLPDLAPFLEAPAFPGAAKQDYFPADDHLIAKTFAALEHLEPGGAVPRLPASAPDLNLYLAIWLAIGFGLRKSEVAQVRKNAFLTRDGATWLRLATTTKNGSLPEIRAQLGAAEKLQPHLDQLQPEDYLLRGHPTERTEDVFRRCSTWMRDLGWQTEKTFHEWRAWSGCQIALAHGLLAARDHLRHASIQTTERNYGRYLKTKIAEVKLTLPNLPTPTFTVVK